MKKYVGGNLFWGVFFILAAAFIILNRMGMFVGIGLFDVIITVLLIPIIVKSTIHRQFGGIFVPLAIIASLYGEQLGIQNFTPWPLIGAALFLSIGLSFIFPQNHHRHFAEGELSESTSAENERCVNIVTHFSGITKYIISQNLEEVNITSSFGGTKVYFDKAQMSGEKVKVTINGSFSGVELYIPKGWEVENHIDCSIGGVDVEGSNIISETPKILSMTGYIKCSGVKVIYI